MILLDTNVVFEGLRANPDPKVREWLDAQPAVDLFLCTPVLAEVKFGAELLPLGARRLKLEQAIRRAEEGFGQRILVFDRAAAYEYGKLVAERDRLGRPIATMDGMIAAIARAHGAAVATRDTYGFSNLGLQIINPFQNNSV